MFTVDDFVMLQHRPVTVEHCFKLVAKDQRLLGLLCRISESTAADSRYVITQHQDWTVIGSRTNMHALVCPQFAAGYHSGLQLTTCCENIYH